MVNQIKNNFSFQKRLKSFVYAFKGIAFVFKTQHNAWIHLLATLLVVGLGFIFSIHQNEWIAIIICIGTVLAFETMNTSIELLCDARFPDYDKRAEIIKDTAAGAVLLVALASVIVGLIIFLPKIIQVLS
ncbi:MAG: diacylglycerol kinase family protein [Bacteroidetes bacterium]|nr:diacylglycerol kinase family protein [Bacteroidota bacterium]